MKILQENNTHKAVQNEIDNTIEIWIKGFEIDDLKFKDEFLYSIPSYCIDDLFPIFEHLDEENRNNLNEINS